MPLYRILDDELEALSVSTLEGEGIAERGDLQRLLRDHPDVLGGDLFIVSEEFSDWDESRRRIDLLALDLDGRLVVVELKRTEDGGYMELQAIRYAAMVSNMTFQQLVRTHQQYLEKRGLAGSAEESLRSFLQVPDEPQPDIASHRPRIVLVSGDFSRELTTSVLWLNDVGLDIRCVRLRPYRMGVDRILDVQQIIPLPEAYDYLVRIREKATSSESRDLPDVPWTEVDMRQLSETVTNPSVIALLNLSAASAGEYVSFGEVLAEAGRTQPQTRADLGGFTVFIKKRFGRKNWPLAADWAAAGEQLMYYRMTHEVSRWWRSARAELEEPS